MAVSLLFTATAAAALISAQPVVKAAPPTALPAQRFDLGRVMSTASKRGDGPVRVALTLAQEPIAKAAASPRVRSDLSGRLSPAQINGLRRHGPSAAARVIAAQTATRRLAARRVNPAILESARRLSAVAQAVRRAGGRVVDVQYAGPTLVAEIPSAGLSGLAGRKDIAAVTPAPVQQAMGALANETAAVGASAWWNAGHTGGTGSSDTEPANLAVMDDKIEEDQPLFQGVDFERPMNTAVGTSCDQAMAGCEHGTEVAGMAVASGNGTCGSLCVADTANEKGVAFGLSHVLDADFGTAPDAASCGYDSALWALGFSQPPIGRCTHPMPGASDPAYVHSDSHGNYTSSDDSVFERNLDKFTSLFGAIQTEPSGNDGTAGGGTGRITDSCIAYDVICVGGIAVGDTTMTSDDEIANFSSPGPSPAGRKKPDLVAVAAGGGSTNMTVVEQRYTFWNRLERGDTGTSFASPQVAGAAALLYGAGLTDPLIVKAILLDSTTLGRATAASPMGTQTTWQPDWGWGELNLDSAYQERDDFAAGAVGPGDVRFYRASVNSGDRATLVWNRRVAGAADQTAPPQAMTLSDLNLYEYADASPHSLLASSTSGIDNVEQVRGTAGTVVYKVKDESSTIDGATAEPFALAARNPLTPIQAPKPMVTLTLDRSSAHQGEEVTVTETVHNSSNDLAGASPTSTLALPAGVNTTSGGSTTWSPGGGTLAPGATASHQWTIAGGADGLHHLTATAGDDAYGETFTAAQASATLDVDSTPPLPAISCSHPLAASPEIAVTWGATDLSNIAGYDLDVSTDGAPYIPWLAAVQQTSATFTGAAGHSFWLRVRATDSLGNASGFAACGPITVGFAAVPPAAPLPQPTKLLPSSPKLRLSRLRAHRGRLTVDGRVASKATGRVSVIFTRRGRRPVRGRVAVHHGRYHLSLRLSGGRARGGLLRIQYSGDRSFAPQRISRRVK